MGAYTAIAGWITVDPDMANEAIETLSDFVDKPKASFYSRDRYEHYLEGWHLQTSAINGSLYAFYGASIRTELIDLIQGQVSALASLIYVNKEDDYYVKPNGYFLLEEDGTYSHPDVEWVIEHGIFSKRKR